MKPLLTLTTAERRLLSVLLDNAGSRLSRAICSDVPREAFEGTDSYEAQKMAIEFEQWNSGNTDIALPYESIGDWAWLRYFAARIRGDV